MGSPKYALEARNIGRALAVAAGMSAAVLSLAKATEILMQYAYSMLRRRYGVDSFEFQAFSTLVSQEQSHARQFTEHEHRFPINDLPSRTELAFLDAQLDMLKRVLATCGEIDRGRASRDAMEALLSLEVGMSEDILPRLQVCLNETPAAIAETESDLDAHHADLRMLLERL